MKIRLILPLIGFILFSCEKRRTCYCSNSRIDMIAVEHKVTGTKKQKEEKCEEIEQVEKAKQIDNSCSMLFL